MASCLIRSAMLIGLLVGLHSYGGAHSQVHSEFLSSAVHAPAWLYETNPRRYQPTADTGVIYTQPISTSGVLYPSSWLTPNGGADADHYVWDNFTTQTTQTITEVHWIGGFSSGGAVVDFSVSFYTSTAANTQPYILGPMTQYLAGGNAGQTAIGLVGGTSMYSYTFTLPTPFTATAGTKYWLQIEAYQTSTPDWGIAAGRGGEGSHYFQYAMGADIHYTSLPGDTAFTLLGPVNYRYKLYLPVVLR